MCHTGSEAVARRELHSLGHVTELMIADNMDSNAMHAQESRRVTVWEATWHGVGVVLHCKNNKQVEILCIIQTTIIAQAALAQTDPDNMPLVYSVLAVL